jgi:hypothetical protein
VADRRIWKHFCGQIDELVRCQSRAPCSIYKATASTEKSNRTIFKRRCTGFVNRRVALTSQQQTAKLAELLCATRGAEKVFDAPHFHEVALRLDRPVAPVLAALAEENILGGYDLSQDFPELGHALLVCATETKTDEDLQTYVATFSELMNAATTSSA